MKKFTGVILCFVLLTVLTVSAYAEEFNGGELFTVNLPEEFKQTSQSDGYYAFSDEQGNSFSVSYVENVGDGVVFCPKNMSKKNIKKYTDKLCAEAEAAMKEYTDSFSIDVLTAEAVEHKNGKDALVCKMKTTATLEGDTRTYYQTMYEFGGVNYKYTFTYTTENSDKKDGLEDVFDTVKITEDQVPSRVDKIPVYAFSVAIVLLILIGIVRFIRTPEKKTKGKN